MSQDNLPAEASQRLTRDEIRKRLIGSTPEAKSEIVSVFGCDIEVRQPNFDAIVNAREIESDRERSVSMIIRYCFVPETEELIFQPMDFEAILKWPWGPDMTTLQQTITKLTNLDIGGAEKDLEEDPSKEP